LWRIVTCQWTHWSLDHLLWDVIVFAVLGSICERFDRRSFVVTVAMATLLVPATVHVACPDIAWFRGLSGVDCALVGLLLANLFFAAKRAGSVAGQIAAIAGAAALMGKVMLEQISGDAIFAASDASWRVVPLSHAAGFVAGVLAASLAPSIGFAAASQATMPPAKFIRFSNPAARMRCVARKLRFPLWQ
jgi:rhomboid family GlyGly-CTERM serine protease